MTLSNDELLRFENVTLGYGRKKILQNVDFNITKSDYFAIVGSNGSGKTTLLRTLLRLIKPLYGQISSRDDLHFGYVPQLQTVDEIYPLTAAEVVLMGRYGRLGLLKQPCEDDRQRVRSSLEEVGIGHLHNHLYRDLSGGQKQRVLIARALVGEPDILVLDEHTNDLDIGAEKAIMALIDRIHAERHLAVVMVSHSLNAVANHCERVGIIREGSCRFAGVHEVLQPAYLQELYGVPLQVLEADGQRVIV